MSAQSPLYVYDSLFMSYFRRPSQCLECYNRRYSVEARPLITDDGGHITLGWSEIITLQTLWWAPKVGHEINLQSGRLNFIDFNIN